MPTYDVYHKIFYGYKVIKQGFLSPSTSKMEQKGFHLIGTTLANSSSEAIKNVESKEHDTQPVPNERPENRKSGTKAEILGENYAREVMCEDRKGLEDLAKVFILYNTGDYTEEQRIDCVVFSYVIEWACLILSNATKEDSQLLMNSFTSFTSFHVFNSNDSRSIQLATEIVQNGIKSYSSALEQNATSVYQLATRLVLMFLELSELERFVKKENGTLEFIEVIAERMTTRIARNQHFTSTFKIKKSDKPSSPSRSINEVDDEPELKVHIKENGSQECSASDLAEHTYAYMHKAGEVISSFLTDNNQIISTDRKREIVAFTFNLYRLGFVLSQFTHEEKKIIVTKLLAMTFSNCNIREDLDISPAFIHERCKLYEASISSVPQINDFGPHLLAQFIAVSKIESSEIIDDFRDMAEVIVAFIRTAIIRNDKLAKNCSIIED